MRKYFHPKTWFLIQWVSTILFVLLVFINIPNTYGVFLNLPVKITLFTAISFVAVIISQMYTYGYFIVNTQDNQIIPLICVLMCGFIDILFSFLLSRMNLYIPYYKSLFIFYGGYSLLCFVNILVYNKVEYIEIPMKELYKIENDEFETTGNDLIKNLEDKYI